MTLFDFNKFLISIKSKIYLIIGRAILTAVKNSEKTQKIQVTLLKDETVTDIERFQEYGFEAYPLTGSAESVIAFINGNRDQGIALCVHDREYRPDDLSEGDVRHYDYRGNKITCSAVGIEIEDKDGNKITCKNTGIEIEDKNSNKVKMESTGMTLETGDASTWKPCIIPSCIFSGAPHGGSVGGIVKLKGA